MSHDFRSIDEIDPERRGTSCHIQWSARFQDYEAAKQAGVRLEEEGFLPTPGISPHDLKGVLFISKELLAAEEVIKHTHKKLQDVLRQFPCTLDEGWIGHFFNDEDGDC